MVTILCSGALVGVAQSAPASTVRTARPAPTTPCATSGSIDFGVDLAGAGWRFTTGDGATWADPAFDDSGWEQRSVPDNWGNTAEANYDGYAWYRKKFVLPTRPAGLSDSGVIAALGFIDDADVTYLNGVEIGKTGAFPPAFDAEWDVPREYYPANGVLRWGQTNTLAVRMYDGTGGGGFYKGPIGLFSKARLRTLSGLQGQPASPSKLKSACAILNKQHAAVAAGDVAAYAATLAVGFFHQGDTADRRIRQLRAWLAQGKVELRDQQAEVIVDAQGRIVVDTIRSWVGADGKPLEPSSRQFLYLGDKEGRELGDHARFFRDSYQSAAMGKRVSFNVYLPPGYTTSTARRFPTVYMLHGINGSNIEWEVRDMDSIVDGLIRDKGIEQSVVIFPDGSSGWYVDSSAGNYRSMIVNEIIPLVDKEYRTIADRDHRGITGVSMGGFGSFSLGLDHPELFSSIASHIGALDFPPLAGTAAEIAANSKYAPMFLVNSMTTDQLLRRTYYFDAGEQDEFRFGEAAKAMDAALTAKLVPHEWQNGPGGHNDAYWVPKLDRSFGLHSAQFRAHPFAQPAEPAGAPSAYTWP